MIPPSISAANASASLAPSPSPRTGHASSCPIPHRSRCLTRSELPWGRLLPGEVVAKKPKLAGRQAVMRDFAEAASARGQHFFYVKIPESLGPLDRGDKYEDP